MVKLPRLTLPYNTCHEMHAMKCVPLYMCVYECVLGVCAKETKSRRERETGTRRVCVRVRAAHVFVLRVKSERGKRQSMNVCGMDARVGTRVSYSCLSASAREWGFGRGLLTR